MQFDYYYLRITDYVPMRVKLFVFRGMRKRILEKELKLC